jgi:hypothetical protein
MSLFDISLETANSLYEWGWRGSIFGAVITTLAVMSLMWGTRIRDRDFEASMAHLNSDAANARLETARIKQTLAWREPSPE